jgi:hypothetical protein
LTVVAVNAFIMALAAVYQQFLAAPSPSHLAENATLNYITTTTTFRGASDIIQHLNTLHRQINKKKENVISLVHGQDAIATEIETGLEFVTSGASYLPALDDNFLADRTVYLPIVSRIYSICCWRHCFCPALVTDFVPRP